MKRPHADTEPIVHHLWIGIQELQDKHEKYNILTVIDLHVYRVLHVEKVAKTKLVQCLGSTC